MALSLSRGFASDQKSAILSVFWLAIIAALSGLALSANLTNLSLHEKWANQASTDHEYSPQLAIDGNLDSNHYHKSCTHIGIATHPWWMVDIDSTHCVGKVTIVNRGDCCSSRLTAAVVRAGLNINFSQNAVCGFPVTSAQASITGAHLDFTCDPPKPARYVSVDIDGNLPGVSVSNILSLCEVIVEEYPMTQCPPAVLPTKRSTHASCGFKLIHEGPCAKTSRPLATSLTASPMPCTFQCKRNVECWFFDFAPTTGRCRLYADRVVDTEPDQDLLCVEYAVVGCD